MGMRGVVGIPDHLLIVRVAAQVAREVAQIGGRAEEAIDAPIGSDGARRLRPEDRLDHEDDVDVVVERLAVAAGHVRVHRLPLARTIGSMADRRKVDKIDDVLGLLDTVHRRNDQIHGTTVEGFLDIAPEQGREARPRHVRPWRQHPRCAHRCVSAGLVPHGPHLSPLGGRVLHLGPGGGIDCGGRSLRRLRAVSRKAETVLGAQGPLRAGRHPGDLCRIPDRVGCGRVI